MLFRSASKLPWGELNVDVVLECTGFYTSKEKAMAHINAGAKKVVISAPAGNDLPTIVYNVQIRSLYGVFGTPSLFSSLTMRSRVPRHIFLNHSVCPKYLTKVGLMA